MRSYLVWLLLSVAVAGCSGGDDGGSSTVTGVVVAVTGQQDVESFVVRNTEGSSRQFTPANPVGFDLAELRALVVSQDQVTVIYEQQDTADYVAVSIDVTG